MRPPTNPESGAPCRPRRWVRCTANRGKVYKVHFYLLNGNWIPFKVEVYLSETSMRRLWEKSEPVAEMTPAVACAVRAAQRSL